MTAEIRFADVEATGLKGDFGEMISFAWKPRGKKPQKISLLDFYEPQSCGRIHTDSDKKLIKAVREVLSEPDVIWCWWYGYGQRKFDVRFINARIVGEGLPPLPPASHLDLYDVARTKYTISSNRLDVWAQFLRLPVQKTPLKREVWRKAAKGDVRSIKYVIDHNLHDVEVLELAYERLGLSAQNHPRVGDWGACRYCGSKRVHRRGKALTSTKSPRYRYQCQECGGWETRA